MSVSVCKTGLLTVELSLCAAGASSSSDPGIWCNRRKYAWFSTPQQKSRHAFCNDALGRQHVHVHIFMKMFESKQQQIITHQRMRNLLYPDQFTKHLHVPSSKQPTCQIDRQQSHHAIIEILVRMGRNLWRNNVEQVQDTPTLNMKHQQDWN